MLTVRLSRVFEPIHKRVCGRTKIKKKYKLHSYFYILHSFTATHHLQFSKKILTSLVLIETYFTGLVCSLPARTGVLAAANPVGGHYNKAKTVSENLKINPALLSRFDLVSLEI